MHILALPTRMRSDFKASIREIGYKLELANLEPSILKWVEMVIGVAIETALRDTFALDVNYDVWDAAESFVAEIGHNPQDIRAFEQDFNMSISASRAFRNVSLLTGSLNTMELSEKLVEVGGIILRSSIVETDDIAMDIVKFLPKNKQFTHIEFSNENGAVIIKYEV